MSVFRWLTRVAARIRAGIRRQGTIALTILIVAAPALAPFGAPTDDPRDLVREYLEAIRDRDVERALEIAGVEDLPAGEESAFLTSDAITDGWVVDSLRTEATSDDGMTAQVTATLRDTTGRTTSVQSSGTFQLARDEGAWSITNPLVDVEFSASPLWYVEVNDVLLDRPGPSLVAAATRYPMFPGIYYPYSTPGDLVTVTRDPLIVLPPAPGTTVLTHTPQVTPTGDATVAAQTQLNTLIDECVSSSSDMGDGSCLLMEVNEEIILEWEVGTPEMDTFTGLDTTPASWTAPSDLPASATMEWKVIRYPTTALSGDLMELEDTSLAFAPQITDAGEFRFAIQVFATGGTLLWEDQSTCVAAGTSPWGYALGVTSDQSPAFTWVNQGEEIWEDADLAEWIAMVGGGMTFIGVACAEAP